jgi:lipooligosaccharide transport system permease protein
MGVPAGFVRNAFQVMMRNVLVWQRVALSSAIGYVGEPLLFLVALGYGLGQVVPELDGMSYAEFIAPGLVVSTVMYTATFEGTFGSYTRMATQHTYDAILATPVTIGELVAGEIFFGGVKACFGGTIVLAVAAAFRLVPAWSAFLVIPLAFLAGLLFSAMALVVSGLAKSYDVFNYYFTLIIAPMYLFGGVFFPLDRMPPWIQHAALAVPLTHVVELSRSLVRGNMRLALVLNLTAVVGFLVPTYFVAERAIRRRLAR